MTDLKIIIAGIQLESGVDSASKLFAETSFAAGAEVIVDKDYLSTIYGGKAGTTFYQIRISDQPICCAGDEICYSLICLDFSRIKGILPLTAKKYAAKVKPGGIIIYDSSFSGNVNDLPDRQDVTLCGVPAYKLTKALFPEEPDTKLNRMKNSVFLGVIFEILKVENLEMHFEKAVRKVFGEKIKIQEQNLKALRAGAEYAKTLVLPACLLPLKVTPLPNRLLLSGNDALSLGALAAGVKTYFGYPITPASSILEFMKTHLKAAIQAEDEIAASAMALAASFAGGRSLTATSGPGFCLMIENISHSGMIEQGMVIIDSQRAGPSTGMPTKTEQSDLMLAIYGNNGEIPKIILAPGDATECFEIMPRAYRLARKYQLPVIVMSALDLSEGEFSVPKFDLNKVPAVPPWPQITDCADPNALAERFSAKTAGGISPKNIPGQPGQIFKVNGAEHNESGYVDASAEMRIRMMKKRMKKLKTFLKEDAQAPKVFGDENAEVILIGWGSTKGVNLEAAERLRKQGIPTKVLHFIDLWPLPIDKIKNLLPATNKIFVVELNFTGQFAKLLKSEFAETGVLLSLHKINRYEGRPMEPRIIIETVLNTLHEEA